MRIYKRTGRQAIHWHLNRLASHWHRYNTTEVYQILTALTRW